MITQKHTGKVQFQDGDMKSKWVVVGLDGEKKLFGDNVLKAIAQAKFTGGAVVAVETTIKETVVAFYPKPKKKDSKVRRTK